MLLFFKFPITISAIIVCHVMLCMRLLAAGFSLCVCADLSVLLVRRGVVGNLEEMQVDHFFHLIVVSPTLAYDHRPIEQEDVPAVQKK